MKTLRDYAIALAKKGFRVFPVVAGGKMPTIKDWPEEASSDEKVTTQRWTEPKSEQPSNFNIGIATGPYKGGYLIVLDIDIKKNKDGFKSLEELEKKYGKLPETLTVETASGGQHRYFLSKNLSRNTCEKLGKGLDTRGKRGYVLGPGSKIGNKSYKVVGKFREPAPMPEWMETLLGKTNEAPLSKTTAPAVELDTEGNIQRAIFYLEYEAAPAIEGEGGDHQTFKVAAAVKDYGISEEKCWELMCDHWNNTCSPPWDVEDLRRKVRNAYAYGSNAPGAASPEADFSKVPVNDDEGALPPVKKLNQNHAFVITGGGHHILWETVDHEGRFKLEHLSETAFHAKEKANLMVVGDKIRHVSRLWMESPYRRSYDGLCFAPQRKVPDRFYNLWRGFSFEPADCSKEEAAKRISYWLDHIYSNVCRDDEALAKWLLGYFAHMIQRPWEKPQTAIVLRGGKGVGKNIAIECVGNLLNGHYMLTSNKRYLVGNFNSHLESLLMFVLDEAFWSGDKNAEGQLKDLITGRKHVIEIKGKEPYEVDNLVRVVIIGNEEWLVPASGDERRFCIFDVGSKRQQNTQYFGAMRRQMTEGGYSALLRYLMEYDLSDVDVNVAPKTEALLDQKIYSLTPEEAWLYDCLQEGSIRGEGKWPERIVVDDMFEAVKNYCRARNIRSRLPDKVSIGKLMKKVLASERHRYREGDERVYVYSLPPLDVCRERWDTYIGQETKWPED